MGRGGQAIARRALILLLALAAVSPAHAQDQDKPKKKRAQPAPAAAAPLEPAPAPNPLLRPPPPPQLRSAVRSSSSRPAVIGRSTTAQCRAQCSEQRLGCLGNPEDTSSCNPNWTQCLSTCAGLGYGRATNP
jgi:hypothetical protein